MVESSDQEGEEPHIREISFTREKKIAVVSQVIDEGHMTLSVANEYGVHDNTIIKWRKADTQKSN